jgi:uncharacterized membrane protein (UPF0182 family)
MTALMIARNDGKDYGKLLLYEFPKSKTVYGPMQVEAQIDQNTEISQDFSLWSSAGSQYSRGNLFVIPIKGFSALRRAGISGSVQFGYSGSKASHRRIRRQDCL